jgi:hypothetical protein
MLLRLSWAEKLLYLAVVKGRAIIMVIGMLAYLAGWMAMPQMMQVRTQPAVDCCAKKMDRPTNPAAPKEGKGEKAGADCCTSCPLCYMMIISVFNRPVPPLTIAASSYGAFTMAYHYQYDADVWRPPSVA